VISDYAEVGARSIVGEMGLVKNHQEIPPARSRLAFPCGSSETSMNATT
jgi:carbonic anhydrase/acetyltransferase-like protein (isoleucine patch superfamily)